MEQPWWTKYLSRKLTVYLITVGFVAYGLVTDKIASPSFQIAMVILGGAAAAYQVSEGMVDAAAKKAQAAPESVQVGQAVLPPAETVAAPEMGALMEQNRQLAEQLATLRRILDGSTTAAARPFDPMDRFRDRPAPPRG